MKWTLIFIVLLLLAGFKIKTDNKQSILTDQDSIRTIVYPEKELINFIDSISKLDPNIWTNEVSYYPDSLYKNQKSLNNLLSKEDFENLKSGCKKKILQIDFVKRVFPDFNLDTTYFQKEIKEGNLPIEFFSFDDKESEFENFAIVPGYDNGLSRECVVYFFDERKLVGEHKVYHRYGLELEHFKDKDDKTVFYYRQNFQSGSGIWWFNFNFYKYSDNSIIPVLNELQNANLQYPWSIRSYWLKTSILKTNPLTLKMDYYNEFPDRTKGEPIQILEDSTEVIYNWDNHKNQFIADFASSKLDRYKILSYYLVDNELLFINSHYKLLQSLIRDKNHEKRQSTLEYLNEVKNEYNRRQRMKASH